MQEVDLKTGTLVGTVCWRSLSVGCVIVCVEVWGSENHTGFHSWGNGLRK